MRCCSPTSRRIRCRSSRAANTGAANRSPGRRTEPGSPSRSPRRRAPPPFASTKSPAVVRFPPPPVTSAITRRPSIRRGATSISSPRAPSIRSTTACTSISPSRARRVRIWWRCRRTARRPSTRRRAGWHRARTSRRPRRLRACASMPMVSRNASQPSQSRKAFTGRSPGCTARCCGRCSSRRAHTAAAASAATGLADSNASTSHRCIARRWWSA